MNEPTAFARTRLMQRFRWTNLRADFADALLDPELSDAVGAALVHGFRSRDVGVIAAVEPRGFVLGALAARELSVGFVLIRKVADEAEEGLDITKLRRRPGRPAMRQGSAPAESLPVRLEPELRRALDDRAAADETTASEIVREALRRYLKAS